MSQFFKEKAHLKTDMKKYSENWDSIFNKYKCSCHLFEECVCDLCQGSRMATKEEMETIKVNNEN